MAGKTIPFKANSYGVLVDTDGTKNWTDHLVKPVKFVVNSKRGYFSLPANELPDTGEPFGSVWKQHLGKVTYFTPGQTFYGYTTTYLQFFDNFVGQKVKITLNNNGTSGPITLHDWDSILWSNGLFEPTFIDTNLITYTAGVSYWIEVEFSTSINATFLAKASWSISFVPQSPTGPLFDDVSVVAALSGTTGPVGTNG